STPSRPRRPRRTRKRKPPRTRTMSCRRKTRTKAARPKSRTPTKPSATAERARLGRPVLLEIAVEREAAAGEDRLPGDVARIRAGEERVDRRQLFRRRGAADRDVAFHGRLGFGIVGPGFVEIGERGARPHAVDTNTLVDELQRQRAREIAHP